MTSKSPAIHTSRSFHNFSRNPRPSTPSPTSSCSTLPSVVAPTTCIRWTQALNNLSCNNTLKRAMSRTREKHRRILQHHSVQSGTCTISKHHNLSQHIRVLSEYHLTPPLSAHAIFAAHGASVASHLCARNFVPTLLEDASIHHDPITAIRNACAAMEAFVLAKSAIDRSYYGTTLLFALLKHRTLFIANIGNSRAILVSHDATVLPLTQPHDASNPHEVSRVQDAGGFFQNDMVNNLVRVTRSIGDMEFKQRKHLTFPNHNMTQDIIIPTPDIFTHNLSSNHHFLVMATAEVWQYLSDSTVTNLVKHSLRRKETPNTCANKVAEAAMAAGASGPLAVMIVLFSFDKTIPSTSPPCKAARPSSLKRHSSNAEQELRTFNIMNNMPAFVRHAQAQHQSRQAMGQPSRDTHHRLSSSYSGTFTTNLSPPTSRMLPLKPSDASTTQPYRPLDGMQDDPREPASEQSDLLAVKNKCGRAQTQLATWDEAVSDASPSRTQIDRYRTEAVQMEQSAFCDRNSAASTSVIAKVASRLSELTASGTTGVADSSVKAKGETDTSPEFESDTVDYNPTGPSKVRYKEDGSVQSGKFAFLKEFGKSFVRRR